MLVNELWDRTRYRPFRTIAIPWRYRLTFSNPVDELVAKGYHEVAKAGKPFTVSYWRSDYVVFPPKYLPDIRRAGKAHLSLGDSICDVFFHRKWVGPLFQSQRMVDVTTKGLNPNLASVTDTMASYANESFETEISNGKSDVGAMELVARLISHIVAPVVFNKELAKNPELLKATQSYLNGVFITGFLILKLPFSEVLGWPLWKLQQRRMNRVIDVVAPVVEKEIRERAQGLPRNGDVNAISCSVDWLNKDTLDTDTTQIARDIASEVNHDFQASTPNPASIIVQMIFKVLEEPKWLGPLREEAENAVKRHGWNVDMIKELRLQDSFIREIGRAQPIAHLQVQRRVMGEPLTLHDGIVLPVGTKTAIATDCQNDPDIIGHSPDFDGFRYAKLAEGNGEDGTWSATKPAKDNLLFGYGNHACPGRLMGVRIIKLVFSVALQRTGNTVSPTRGRKID
ncbi:cytochrome P450 [Lophiotrema nucula]|uniref:Cytochrome P450 n=1 Tax=Lophiotrema nucula TaxID=690887 RepID=A0A6A5Z9S4_9PLEO|nr:cytochrome P450 [Lophiotrema nucula]